MIGPIDKMDAACVHGHIEPPECLACTLAERDALQAENFDLSDRIANAEEILDRFGYRRCNIAACNCNGYHRYEIRHE